MKTIKKGEKGEVVELLQKMLAMSGHLLTMDGDFGSKTHKAVLAFQKQNVDLDGNPLEANGRVNSKTWYALLNSSTSSVPIPELSPDRVTLRRIEQIHPQLRVELQAIYDEIIRRKVSVRFTQVFRTFAEQDQLYAQGRTLPGKRVTNARGGQSYHNYGLAVDIVLLIDNGKSVSWDRELDLDKDGLADWQEIVHVFKHFGWDWGGDWVSFKDYPHFEKSFGYTTAELKEKYAAEDFVEAPYVRLERVS